jgi:hypothetical protein
MTYVKSCGCIITDESNKWVLCEYHSHFYARIFMKINQLFDFVVGNITAKIWVWQAKRKINKGIWWI